MLQLVIVEVLMQ